MCIKILSLNTNERFTLKKIFARVKRVIGINLRFLVTIHNHFRSVYVCIC